MTIQKAITDLNVPRSTLYYWIKKGWLTFEKNESVDRIGRPQKQVDLNENDLNECFRRCWPKYKLINTVSKKTI